jgi:hypothetical protein
VDRGTDDAPERWVSTDEVVKHTGLSRATIYRLGRGPDPLPSKRVRGRRLYQLSAVDARLRRDSGRSLRSRTMVHRFPPEVFQRKFIEMILIIRSRESVSSVERTKWDVFRYGQAGAARQAVARRNEEIVSCLAWWAARWYPASRAQE